MREYPARTKKESECQEKGETLKRHPVSGMHPNPSECRPFFFVGGGETDPLEPLEQLYLYADAAMRWYSFCSICDGSRHNKQVFQSNLA